MRSRCEADQTSIDKLTLHLFFCPMNSVKRNQWKPSTVPTNRRIIFSICVYLYVFVNKMLFIIRALYYSKRQIHFLSFIDRTIHKSLDYVRCFFEILQRACDVRLGVSSTSMNQVLDAMMSAHRASFFLNSDCIVSPTCTMFVQKSHVRSLTGW